MPHGRYQSAVELAGDLDILRASIAGTRSAPAKADGILVLPFADVSPGRDNEYFSDGLTEEIIQLDQARERGKLRQ